MTFNIRVFVNFFKEYILSKTWFRKIPFKYLCEPLQYSTEENVYTLLCMKGYDFQITLHCYSTTRKK
jgi:hypothetical protein